MTRGPIQFNLNLSVDGDGGVAGCGVHGCRLCLVAKGINQLPEDAIQLILLELVLVDVGLRQVLDDGREVLEHVRRLGGVPVVGGGCDLPKGRSHMTSALRGVCSIADGMIVLIGCVILTVV